MKLDDMRMDVQVSDPSSLRSSGQATQAMSCAMQLAT
jgi:hypothetical protein